jgi:hypothetical protein
MGQPGTAQKRGKGIIWQVGFAQKTETRDNWAAGDRPEKGQKGSLGCRGQPRKRGTRIIGHPGAAQKKETRDNWAAGGSPEKRGNRG